MAAVVIGAGCGIAGAQSSAALITETGWWSRQPGASAPQGGFEVARAPDGDLSVAALRIRVDKPVLTKALLVLLESSGVAQDRAVLQVCQGADQWTPANPGPMASAPKAACDQRTIRLARNANQGAWTANVVPLLSGSTAAVSIVVMPVPGSSGLPVDPGFQVEFSGASLDAEGEDAPAATSSGSSASGDASGTSSPPSDLPASAPAASALGAPAPPATGAFPVATEAIPSAPGQEAGSFPRRRDFQPPADDAQPWGRLLLFVPVSALLGLAAIVARRRLSLLFD